MGDREGLRRTSAPRAAAWSAFIGDLLLAAVLWHNATPIADSDIWWHLKTGELIWRTKSVPRVDPFS